MSLTPNKNPYAVFAIKEFRLFIAARFFLTIAIQMQSVIVGWQVYQITKNEFALGMIGLAEAIPFIVISLISGHVADSYDRRKIIRIASSFFMMDTLLLFYFSLKTSTVIALYGATPIFCVIVLVGITRGFLSPAVPSLLTQLIPRELYPNSATWNSTVWHVGAIAGPAIAGLIYGYFGASTAYGIDIVFLFLSIFFFSFISFHPLPQKTKGESLMQSLTAGIKFVSGNKIILGAISLDLFAVLFGGAIAMLPAIADKVLHVGPEALGMLRAAPAVGAVMMALIMAYFPPLKNAGTKLFLAVIAFGICTILFALSTNFYLSFFLLAMTGAFDNVSVVIRHTIMQLMTPDDMRGRVSAVNSIFIGSSNEIGAFESGTAARLLGLVPSIIFGGVMTIIVVGLVGKISPSLRKMSLEKLK